MRRRGLFVVAAAAALAPMAARGQGQARHRIGFLSAQSPGLQQTRVEAMLAEQGYVDGGNAVFVRRFAGARRELLPALAEELLKEEVAVIMTMSTSATLAAHRATLAAHRATTAVPIVVVSTGDAVALGLGETLDRPGANVTGNSILGQGLATAQLGALAALVPGLSRVAFFGNGLLATERLYHGTLRAAGGGSGIDVSFADTRRPAEFATSFATLTGSGAQAVLVASGGNYFDQRQKLVELATAHRLPALFFRREYVEAGGLVSCAPSWRELYGNAASYVRRILGGMLPSALPILQPSRFDVSVNARTARLLGLAIPPALGAEVIE